MTIGQGSVDVELDGEVLLVTQGVTREHGERTVSKHVTVINTGHVIRILETVYVTLDILDHTAVKSVHKGCMALVARRHVCHVLMELFVIL